MAKKKLDFSFDSSISLGEALGLAPTEPSPCPCGCRGGHHGQGAEHGEEGQDGAGNEFGARIRLSLTRAGRGGKTVTRVLGFSSHRAPVWLKKAQGALGVGGALEEGGFFLQGDQRERLKGFLSEAGFRDVK